MPVPILPIWWGISFRYLAGKHFNILRTAQIFPLVTSTFLATRRKIFVDVGFTRTRNCKNGWGCGSINDLPLSTRLEFDHLISQWDKSINTSGNYFWIKQIPLSLCGGCWIFIWLPFIHVTIIKQYTNNHAVLNVSFETSVILMVQFCGIPVQKFENPCSTSLMFIIILYYFLEASTCTDKWTAFLS